MFHKGYLQRETFLLLWAGVQLILMFAACNGGEKRPNSGEFTVPERLDTLAESTLVYQSRNGMIMSTGITHSDDAEVTHSVHFRPRYTLNASTNPSSGGVVTPTSGVYDHGTEVKLTATPALGYRFDYWSGDISSTSIIVNISMNSNKSITAHFMSQYSLNTSVSPQGSGTVEPANGIFDADSNVTVAAAPAKGYVFDHWEGDVTDTSSLITVTINSSKSVIAYFRESFVSEDGRVGFILNKIEYAQTWPYDPSPYDSSNALCPKSGNNFFVVHLTTAFVPEGYIDPTCVKSILVDTNNIRYESTAWTWEGIKFENPLDMASSAYLVEGTSTILLFELPIAVKAMKLELIYKLRKTWKDSQFEEGRLNIPLK